MSKLRPSCSVVIATLDRPRELERCLQALAQLTVRPDEIIVVDNSFGDPNTERVAGAAGARYVIAPATGLSGARNAGARAAVSEVVAFLDDDAVLADGWLPPLLEPFDESRVMAVAGRIVPLKPDPIEQGPPLSHSFDAGPIARVIDRTNPIWFEITNFGGLGGGGNMAIRRAAFQLWPGFRENIGLGSPLPGGEENYAFFELVKRGWCVAYAPQSVAHHPYPETAEGTAALDARGVIQAAGYATLLFVEEVGLRGRTIRYGLEAALGRKRHWRASTGRAGWRELRRRTVWQLVIRGAVGYWKSRVAGSREGSQHVTSPDKGRASRMLLLSPSGGFGYGIERIVAAIARAWDGKVERIDLLRPEAHKGSSLRPKAPSTLNRAGFALRAALSAGRTRPEVIVTAHVNLLPVAGILAMAFRARLVLIAHGTEVWVPMKFLRRLLIRRCDEVIAPSTYTARWLAARAAILRSQVKVLPWPIDAALASHARQLEEDAERQPVLLTVSRIAREHRFKGHFTIARSLPLILARKPEARWVIVGDGDDTDTLRDYCSHLGVSHAVVFRGSISDTELARAYVDASVFVMPSVADATADPPIGEGFGLVYAEAAAFGLPAVSSRESGGALDIVWDGETGLSVPGCDRFAVADAVVRLLEDHALRCRLGRTARQRVLARHMPEHFEDAVGRVLQPRDSGAAGAASGHRQPVETGATPSR